MSAPSPTLLLILSARFGLCSCPYTIHVHIHVNMCGLQNMYFEAVETILEKLSKPGIKGAAKANLTRQLREIDPDGKIRAFLEGKADRPDLSDEISRSR